MNDRVYSSREQNASRLSITCNRAQLQSHDSSNSIISNPTSSSSSSSSSSNLSNLSLSDIEEADQLPASASTVRAANVSEDATGNRPSSSRPPARTAYSGLSTVGIGFRGFQNTILSPAQRIAKDSLPSPPATNREGESEQGSIGSARGQTSARREHGNSNTRSTTATQSHMPSDKRLTDAYATIRRSPVNATLADQQAYPNLVTAEHDTHHAQNTYQFNASSSAGRSPLTYSRSSSSSANTRSRSVSPLATLVDLPSTSNLHRSSPREPSNTGSNKVKDTRSSEFREDLSHNASQLSRTSSTSSHTSQVISSMADLKGKGREIAPTSVERKPSISASKIREASKASRARVRHVSDLIWCEAIADMRPELYSTSEPASEAPSPPAQNNPGQPRYSVSPQSSRTSLSRPTSASPQQSTQTLETAARLSPIDGRLPIHDSSPSSSTSRNSIPGSDAFVTSKRNSMISLASRAGEDIHSLPHSTGTMNGLSKLASKEVGDRSLEEGEILEETPPVGIERVYSHETRRQSNSQIRTIDQERRDEVPRHSRHKDVDDSFQYAARLSRPTGYTSLPATEDLTARSTTPSPLHGVGKLLVSPTEDNEDRRSSYSHRNTPHRTSAARSDSSRPSTAGSSTTREQRESRYSTNGKTGEHEDDTSRTPRRTPFHRRYESEARFRSNHSSRVDPALDITSDRQDPRFAAEGRPHSSLLRHSVEPSDDSRSRGSTDGRRKVYSSQDDGYTHDTHDLRRSHSVISNAHRGSGQSAYSTRSNRTSYLQAESSVDQGRHSSERHYSRAPPSQDRQHSYSETGRTTPRLRERPASRVGQSSSAVSGSHSVRNISDQLGRSNDLSSDQRARRRTLSDGLDRSLSRPASQADGEVDVQCSASRTFYTDILLPYTALVFVDTSRGAPDSKQQFSTLPSSASRSRVSLRNLEVASPDWWREVSEIRDKANNASADRPLSRASNHRSLASLTSPESSAARSERNRTPAGRLASMASSMSPKGYTGRTDSRRSTARDGQDHADRPYTPYKASPSRPASRSTYHHHQYPSATDQAWVTREVGEESHYGLLREASNLQLGSAH